MMRISGLATGMDTEKIIADLMKAQRLPLDKITQKKQYMQWQMDDYRSINRNLKATSDKVFDTVMKQSTFMAKTVNVSDEKAIGIKSLNATSEFSGTIAVHQLATQSTLQSSGEILELKGKKDDVTLGSLNITGSKISITSPGSTIPVEVTYESTDTVKSLIDKINKQTGVNAFFDTHTGKIAMTAKEGGDSPITVTNGDGGNLVEVLKLDSVPGPGSSSVIGQNAIFTFNGLQTERPSNTFNINGFEITLKQVTAPIGQAGGTSVTFDSTPDTDKVVDAVTQFVNDYNKMIEELNAKIREPKYRSFQPLSDEQKKDMKENEIKLWEEKAMSGTLRNDPEISSMLTKLRTLMSSTIETSDGTKLTMKDLGITASSSYTENGKLSIDETKLRKAISENPNNVYELFAKPATEVGGVEQANTGGLARQFRAVIDGSSKIISAKAGSTGSVNDTFTMGRTMKEINNQITKYEDRLKMVESRYWKQFNAMENAIQRANAQSASLMSALGGGA